MPATVRLMRFGKKGHPTYRIVVIDKRKKGVGSYLTKIGTYNPMTSKDEISIDDALLTKWVQKGAIISEGMRKLLKKRASLSSQK